RRCHCPSTVSADLVDPAPANPLRRAGPGGQQAIEATSHLEDDPRPPTPWLSDRTLESSTQPSTSAVIFRAWRSSSIILRRWVTGTPPVTHIYIKAIKQPTLHYLTRSVCPHGGYVLTLVLYNASSLSVTTEVRTSLHISDFRECEKFETGDL